MKTISKGFAIIAFFVLVACNVNLDLTGHHDRGDLASATFINTHTPAASEIALAALGVGGITAVYSVNCYALTYKTPDVRGKLIDASGLVCVPLKSSGASSPILSFQHGTILTDDEAPSSPGSQNYQFGQGFASIGYIAVVPDYVGYAASTDQLHPYLHASTLASATIDMIRAAREHLRRNNFSTNGKLFLAGYSEGGYATLAAQREMLQSFPSEFPVTASVPGAGPYDLTNTAKTTLAANVLGSVVFTAFFVRAYDAIFDSPSRLSEIFRTPYDAVVANSFNGDTPRSVIESSLTNVTASLFNEPFLSNFRDNGETTLKAHIAENDIFQWQPASPTHFFHGVDDEVVPFANATTAVTAMQASGNASLVTCNAGGFPTTHENCALPYVIYTLSFFNSFSPGL